MARIENFEIFRSSDGSTENIAATSVYARIRLSTTDTSKLSSASLTIEYSPTRFNASNATRKDISSTFGVTSSSNMNLDKTILIGSFSTSSNYYFTLYFYDGTSGAAPAPGVIFGSKIPFVIAKNNCGVAVGGMSNGTSAAPKFESFWPAYFLGGIANLGESWTELSPVNGTTPADYGGGTLRCCAIGNLRIIDGSVLIKPGSSTVVIAELPNVADWAPSTGVFSINACNGARIARIVVGGIYEENKGKLCLSWVRDLSDGGVYTDSAIWVQCNIHYWMPVGDYG